MIHWFLRFPFGSALRKICNITICNSRLEQKDIIIFDSNRSESLKKYLDISAEKVHVLEIKYIIFMDLRFVINLLINFSRILDIKTCKNVKKLVALYFITVIRTVRPKVVISLIDDSHLYSSMMMNIEDVHMIAIANGPRPNYVLKRSTLYLSNYYVYGTSEIDKINCYSNITAKKTYPVGSISCGYHHKKVMGLPSIYDICLISQLPNSFCGYRNDERGIDVMNTILLSDQYLFEYVSNHNLRLCVQLRTNKKEEIEYYKYKYGDMAELVERKESSYYTYKTIAESKLTIGFNSSCILEAWALGKKAICVDFTGGVEYNNINEEKLIIRNSSSDYFKRRLHELLIMNDAEYKKYTRDIYSKYIANNLENQPHEIIKSKIKEYLN